MANRSSQGVRGTIDAEVVEIGRGVVVEEGVLITGQRGKARRVALGDHCFIGRRTRVLCPEFVLGDYSKLHAYSFGHGENPLRIGRNCWIGGNTVLDSMGGLDIDDNVGIGSQSQLWTHAQFGDIVEGSRFYSRRYMHVERDVWFVGHCIVSPVDVGERSMALAGSVITRSMLANHIYGGVPAVDMSDRMGTQFVQRTVEAKAEHLKRLLQAWLEAHPQYTTHLAVVRGSHERRADVTWFDVSTRTYNKRNSEAEISFLKEHVPLIKFVPDGVPHFYVPNAPSITEAGLGGLGEHQDDVTSP